MTPHRGSEPPTLYPARAEVAAFSAGPGGVGAARRFVAGELAGHPCCGDAELLASELVTNALTYGEVGEADRVTVTLVATDTLVRISVADQGARPPCVCRLGTGEDLVEEVTEHGRGLVLLDRLVAGCGGEWGFRRDGRGSAVWFEVHPNEHTPWTGAGPAAAYPADAGARHVC